MYLVRHKMEVGKSIGLDNKLNLNVMRMITSAN